MKTCKTCGKELIQRPTEGNPTFAGRRYCDRKCYAEARTKQAYEPRYCICCGNEIQRKHEDSPAHYARKQFCSKECQGRLGRSNPDAQFVRSVSQYLDDHAADMERAYIAVTDWPLQSLPPQVKKLWCPMRHKWYVREVWVLR